MDQELHDLVNRIEEIKEKLSDADYKDLLELSQKYHDKIKDQEAKAKKKFMRCLVIKSRLIYYVDDDNDEYARVSDSYHYRKCTCGGDCDGCDEQPDLIWCKSTQIVESHLFEVKQRSIHFRGPYINEKINVMSLPTFNELKENKYVIGSGDPNICYVYVDDFEV
jgi:hypothetical protein